MIGSAGESEGRMSVSMVTVDIFDLPQETACFTGG
jgi:hypothetical protein